MPLNQCNQPSVSNGSEGGCWTVRDLLELGGVFCDLQSGRTFLDPEEKQRRIAMQKEQAATGDGRASSVSSEEARRAAINAEADAERLAADRDVSSMVRTAEVDTQQVEDLDVATAVARPATPKD